MSSFMMRQTVFLKLTALIIICVHMNYAYAGQDAKMAPKNSKEVNVMMQADRIPPANVSPIIIEGIRYEVIHWGKD
ncbi:hypothetical protein Metal_3094 [Methylomicrobium album BG8]|uniref:Uncharacterized protein n=2 Tax=Methylococcaceae TaxID=403 RepID=H8GN58_METAL|nr:hypothetical protein Metal_3094 [Methylomicrobium album BG8]